MSGTPTKSAELNSHNFISDPNARIRFKLPAVRQTRLAVTAGLQS
jgi:hypothetical protein